jgi:hypothetical protein
MSESFHLNKNQIDVLNGYLDSGNYPAAYRYLRDIAYSLALNAHAIGNYASASELLKMANWLDYAASINANVGSLVATARAAIF